MTDRYRDAFGRLIARPEELPRELRIEVLRATCGRLRSDGDPGCAWLGDRLAKWLGEGGRFEHHLGIAALPGSRRTAARIIRETTISSLLTRLAVEAGSAARASRWLRGIDACPSQHCDLVRQLRELGSPSSTRAFSRARKLTRPD